MMLRYGRRHARRWSFTPQGWLPFPQAPSVLHARGRAAGRDPAAPALPIPTALCVPRLPLAAAPLPWRDPWARIAQSVARTGSAGAAGSAARRRAPLAWRACRRAWGKGSQPCGVKLQRRACRRP